MNRNAVLLLLTVLLVLAAGFLVLIWMDMRSSVRQQQRTSAPPLRQEAPHPRTPPPAVGRRTPQTLPTPQTASPCTGLGVVCASEYFGTWVWPEDRSCHSTLRDGYPVPDPRCTPGGVVPGLTVETLRDPAWRTRCIRDCQSSSMQKHAAYAWYGLPAPENNIGANQVCELDHLVPLELGGADGLGNIWPECGPDDVRLRARFFKQKDIVENYLAAMVRAGEMPLDDAQRGIANDWVQYLPAAKRACHGGRC